jgi:hypothetical protein
MNFKPTLWKTIVSILVPLLISFMKNIFVGMCDINKCPTIFDLMLREGMITLGLIIIIYLIWSFFQKK